MNQIVLVIDDADDIHSLLEVRLRSEGVTLHHARDAHEGLRMARALLPDLVLLDVDLPDICGLDVCRLLKADSATRPTPVIFLTGANDLSRKVSGFDLGAVDYVTKPFEPAELRARVRSALRTKRYQDLLATRAQIDGLTGLWNRAHFDRHLDEQLARRLREGREVGLLLIDIDHFKAVNDQFGHPVGDRVITWISDAIGRLVRAEDAACRYGGEEFAIVLADASSRAAFAVGKRVRQALLASPFGGRVHNVTVSVGAGSTEGAPMLPFPAVALVERVDAALYLAKRSGRDRVCPMIPFATSSFDREVPRASAKPRGDDVARSSAPQARLRMGSRSSAAPAAMQ